MANPNAASGLAQYGVPADVAGLKPKGAQARVPGEEAFGAAAAAAGPRKSGKPTRAVSKADAAWVAAPPRAGETASEYVTRLQASASTGSDYGDDDEGESPDEYYAAFGSAGVSRAASTATEGGGAPVPERDAAELHMLRPDSPSDSEELRWYKGAVDSILRDFLREGDLDAALSALHDLGAPALADHFVHRALTAGVEGTDAQREQVSRLLSAGYALDISMLAIGRGFERLLMRLRDLELDAPAARVDAAKFIARAVADEILPPVFLTDGELNDAAPDVMAEARVRLSEPHALSRMSRVWGVAGAIASVDELKAVFKATVDEYYASGGGPEARADALRSFAEAGVPHFWHEAAYRLVVRALEEWPGRARADAAVALLADAVAAASVNASAGEDAAAAVGSSSAAAAAAAAAGTPSKAAASAEGGAGAGAGAGLARSASSRASTGGGSSSGTLVPPAMVQTVSGLRRVAAAVTDIERDCPRAREGIAHIVAACIAAGALPAGFELPLPPPGAPAPSDAVWAVSAAGLSRAASDGGAGGGAAPAAEAAAAAGDA